MTEHSVKRKITEIQKLAENSVDGISRPPMAEEAINAICRSVLNGSDGDAFMDYLRSITTNVVMHPTASDAELRMQEGMRRLAGILDARRRSKAKG